VSLTAITLPSITTHNGDGKFQNYVYCMTQTTSIFNRTSNK